jgi:hypothetical protein
LNAIRQLNNDAGLILVAVTAVVVLHIWVVRFLGQMGWSSSENNKKKIEMKRLK